MKVRNYTTYLKESLDIDKIEGEFGEEYIELQKDILFIINDILEENSDKSIKMADLKGFISEYISDGKSANMIDVLIEDNDIFNFYLKHQTDFDELLNSKKYMTETPDSHGVFSLYDVVIDGTKFGILEIIKNIENIIK